MAKLTVLVGIPASGKSTYAEKMIENFRDNDKSIMIVSTDRIRKSIFGDENYQGDNQLVFQNAFFLIANALSKNVDVVFDACSIRKKERKNIISTFYRHQIDCVVFKTDLNVCLERNRARQRHVPEDVIRRMSEAFEDVCQDEGFIEIKRVDC